MRRTLVERPVFARFLERLRDQMGDVEGSRPRHLSGATPSLLCLHGFTGVPQEVELAVGVAQELGLAAEAPLLPGHGTSPLELARTGYEDWLRAARSSFDDLRKKGPVVLVGLSMGSLLATELTLDAPGDVAGLVLLSNAFWLKSPYPAWALRAVDRLRIPNFHLTKKGPDLGDPEARASHLTYPAQPVRGGIEVLRAGERLRRRLGDLHRPTLLLHGALDQVCPVENAWKASALLGARRKRVVIYPHSHHILSRDVEREDVRCELLHFVQSCLAEHGD